MRKRQDIAWCPVLSPVQPHELPRHVRVGLEAMLAKVVQHAAHKGAGQDMLLQIYMAGMHHAREATT